MKDSKTIKEFEEANKLDIEKIIKTYNSYLYTIIKKSISNPEEIEEILSDVFLTLWKNRKILQKDVNVKSYLVGITKNLIKKRYRYYNIEYMMESIEDLEDKIEAKFDFSNLIENREKSKIIEESLSEMKYQERQIFDMFYYQNKRINDIARILNISVTKVKVTLYRLRKILKKKFKERGYDYGK